MQISKHLKFHSGVYISPVRRSRPPSGDGAGHAVGGRETHNWARLGVGFVRGGCGVWGCGGSWHDVSRSHKMCKCETINVCVLTIKYYPGDVGKDSP